METLFNNTEVNDLANNLLNNGFDIIRREAKDNYFTYHKNGNIAYFQLDRMEGATISTVNIPCKECGTGFRVVGNGRDDIKFDGSIECFEAGFVIAPNWASSRDRNAVKKFTSLEHFLSRETILKYEVIKAKNLQTI